MTRASRREYAAVQQERYLRSTRAGKRQLLDEVVAVTGMHPRRGQGARASENEEGFFVSSRDSAMREKGALNEDARRRLLWGLIG